MDEQLKTKDLSQANVAIDLNTVSSPAKSNKNNSFWRGVFSGDNGNGSASRVGTLSIIWVTLLLLTILVIRTNLIPERIMSLGLFAALLIVTIYSPAKIAEILANYFEKK